MQSTSGSTSLRVLGAIFVILLMLGIAFFHIATSGGDLDILSGQRAVAERGSEHTSSADRHSEGEWAEQSFTESGPVAGSVPAKVIITSSLPPTDSDAVETDADETANDSRIKSLAQAFPDPFKSKVTRENYGKITNGMSKNQAFGNPHPEPEPASKDFLSSRSHATLAALDGSERLRSRCPR